MRIKTFLATAAVAALIGAAGAAQAAGSDVLVTDVDATWGYDTGANMTDVFGAGNFSEVDFSVNAASLFSNATSFVMLEGGDSSTAELAAFIGANSPLITSWVTSGGHLLIESATNQGIDISGIGPGTLENPNEGGFNSSGTLTAAGVAAFTFTPTPTTQGGNYLAHDLVTGTGLTDFMDGNDVSGSIIAGTALGAGYIMYSGLTASEFHDSGNGLTDDVIAYTAGAGGVPEPAAWAMMLVGFGGLGAVLRRRRSSMLAAAA